MTNDLSHLQELMQAYYDQIQGHEKALVLAVPGDEVIIKQRIKHVEGKLSPVREKYWGLLESQMAHLDITEADAEQANADIIQNLAPLEREPAVKAHAELLKLLTEIKAELTKPEIPASGKFKTAITLIPGFLSYEMDLDTKGLLRRLFPTFSKLAEKLPKSPAQMEGRN
jgi:hypothetical protein